MITLNHTDVVFRSEDHTYWLADRQLQGITSTLLRRAFPDKYADVDPEVLANAARRGTQLHEAIAFADRFGADDGADKRVLNYLRIKEEHRLTTVENEYLVSDLDRYASSVDIVMENDRGEVCLVDTKTTYSLDRRSVSLQLSIYRRIFEQQNPELKVAHIYCLYLPNRDQSIAELIELSPYDDETLDRLFQAEADAHIDQARTQLLTIMEQRGLSQIKSGYYTVSYIGAKTSKKFDSARFKKEHKDLYAEYQTETETKATIRITAH